MFLLDNKIIPPGQPFVHGDIQYPGDWLQQATPADREAIGVIERPDPVRPDDRFHYVSWDAATFTYTTTPKDLDQLKAQFIEQTKRDAYGLLAQTDWVIIRGLEDPAKKAAPDVLTYRKEVRAAESVYSDAIKACTTVDELIAVVSAQPDWPLTAEEKAKRTTHAGESLKGDVTPKSKA